MPSRLPDSVPQQPALVRLFDTEPHVRLRAVDELALGPVHHLYALREVLLGDEDASVRAAVPRRLAQANDQRVVAWLLEAVRDARPSVREASWNALARLEVHEALALAEQAIREEEIWWVRRAAVRATARIGGEGAIPLLLQALGDPFWRARYAAVQALAALAGRSEPARRALETARHSELETVRRAAEWILSDERALPEPQWESVPGVDEDPAVTTSRLEREPLPALTLVRLLGDAHDSLRRVARRALEKNADLRVARAVAGWLDEPRVPHAAEVARSSLEEMQVDSLLVARSILAEHATVGSGQLAWACATALQRGELSDLTQVRALLRDGRESARVAAACAWRWDEATADELDHALSEPLTRAAIERWWLRRPRGADDTGRVAAALHAACSRPPVSHFTRVATARALGLTTVLFAAAGDRSLDGRTRAEALRGVRDTTERRLEAAGESQAPARLLADGTLRRTHGAGARETERAGDASTAPTFATPVPIGELALRGGIGELAPRGGIGELAPRGRIETEPSAASPLAQVTAQALADEDPWVRQAALSLQTAPLLAVTDPDPPTRRLAAAVLTRERSALEPELRRALAQALSTDEDAELRAAAATLLLREDVASALPWLLRLSREPGLAVRGAAASALESASELNAMLATFLATERSAASRMSAFTWLLRSGDALALERLVVALAADDELPEVKEHLVTVSLVFAEPLLEAHPELLARQPRARLAMRQPPAPLATHPATRLLGNTGVSLAPLVVSGAHELDASGLAEAVAMGATSFFWEPGYRSLTRFLQLRRAQPFTLITGSYNSGATWLRRDVESHLRALRREHLDVFLMFWARSAARLDAENFEVLSRLKEEGKIRTFGFSTHLREMASDALERTPWPVLMTRYSAAHPGAETRLLPTAARAGAGVLTFSATSYGRLTQRVEGTPSDFQLPTAPECYQFALAHPAVAAVVSAPRKYRELVENLAILEGRPLSTARGEALRAHGLRVREHSHRFNALVRQADVAPHPELE